MSTVFPAAVRMCAAVEPPAPLPMMQKSNCERLRAPRTRSSALRRFMSAGPVAEQPGRGEDRVLDELAVGRQRARNHGAAGSQLVGIRGGHGMVRTLDVAAGREREDGVAERLVVALEADHGPALSAQVPA